jgi:hypothetical protein
MSTTPRTDAAIKDVDVAFLGYDGLSSAPEPYVEVDFARQLETELTEARAKLADEKTRSACANNQAKTLADVVLRQTDEINGLRAEVQKSAGEWATLMSDVHDYFADEKADRSRGRVTLLLTLLGSLRTQRDEARAEVERLRGLLAFARCPDCDGSGIAVRSLNMEEPEIEQCRWCYERDAARKATP